MDVQNNDVENIEINASLFRSSLLNWYNPNRNPMPWKGLKDPYKVWVSEIMLQQTRVDQVRSYFVKFIQRFPDIDALAAADQDEVLDAWQGLGFNRRALNLHAAAKYLKDNNNAVFPNSHEKILSLPGIGPYAAAAISSFSFEIPVAVVDTNVIRLISRLKGIQDPSKNPNKKQVILEADRLKDENRISHYNQAIMEFGAEVCTPRNPNCNKCPLQQLCVAFKKGIQSEIPIQKVNKPKKTRYFHYFLMANNKGAYLTKRTKNDIWKEMFELPLIETDNSHKPEEAELRKKYSFYEMKDVKKIEEMKQTLSHQVIHAYFYEISGRQTNMNTDRNFVFYSWEKILEKTPFPKIVGCFLSEYFIHLKKNKLS